VWDKHIARRHFDTVLRLPYRAGLRSANGCRGKSTALLKHLTADGLDARLARVKFRWLDFLRAVEAPRALRLMGFPFLNLESLKKQFFRFWENPMKHCQGHSLTVLMVLSAIIVG
jgi:hypothetical protein